MGLVKHIENMANSMYNNNMKFEWDERKNQSNLEKHGVSFEEAQEGFFDINRIIIKDEKHSKEEERFYCIGKNDKGIITIRFTMRGVCIRIIGAGYWREGKQRYERENDLH
jgi:uncharacterized protein